MNFTDASELDRKYGVRWGERGVPVLFRLVLYDGSAVKDDRLLLPADG
jgi:hypothetical protein